MKQLLFLPILATSLSTIAQASEPEWELHYVRTCTFPLEGDTPEPETCDQLVRHWVRYDEAGKRYTIYQYKWVGENGREVVYESHIGGFGVGIFTIGVLSDSLYRGGSSFDPAVSHALHRSLTVIGVPNDIYTFVVEDILD